MKSDGSDGGDTRFRDNRGSNNYMRGLVIKTKTGDGGGEELGMVVEVEK